MLADGTNTYLYGNARLAQYQTAMQYFGADGLGSVRQLYDASGQVVGSSRYDPFGNVMSQGGMATSVFAFAGEQQDATGLEYLRARYYSSAQGRFTTHDSWLGDPGFPISFNAWAYADSNPINRVDPSGMATVGRYPGMCPEPPVGKTAKRPVLISYRDGVYLYCGEFQLTAYQFVSGENLYSQGGPAGQATAPFVLSRDGKSAYRTSAGFIHDVENNGTGHSDNPTLTFNCPTGYFNSIKWTSANTFNLSCGKGRPEFDVSDARRVAASDNGVIGNGEEILIPLMRDRDEATLTVLDTGGGVKGYHLDVFVGEGPGIRMGDALQVPSSIWNRDHKYLGTSTIILPSGKQAEARGPTPIYQKVLPGLAPYYRWVMCIMRQTGAGYVQTLGIQEGKGEQP